MQTYFKIVVMWKRLAMKVEIKKHFLAPVFSLLILQAMLVLALCILAGCSDGEDMFPEVEKTTRLDISSVQDLNLILINIDSLRPDHLGCFGYGDIDTANIDGLADRGIRFENAFAQTPQSLPNYCSLITGTTPLTHGVRADDLFYLPGDRQTLAEHLKEQGFATAAFIAKYKASGMFGMDQGFDLYDQSFGMPRGLDVADQLIQTRDAEQVVSKALNWVRKNRASRFFLWLHFSDLIAPAPPQEFREKYSTNPYDGALAYVDNAIGRFLQKLNDLGLYQKTLIILTSDHGVAFGEHGEPTYGLFIYDSTLHIPLIFHNPRLFRGAREIKEMVRDIDIIPSVLELMGLESMEGIQGTSLVPVIKSDDVRLDLTLYCENTHPLFRYRWSGQRGMRTGEWKYIYAPVEELYRLTIDPHESNNIAEENPRELEKMRKELATRIAFSSGDEPVTSPQAALQTFGYASSFGDMHGISFVDIALRDPKESLDIIREMAKAMSARTVDMDIPKSIEMYDQLLTVEPENPAILKALGNNYMGQGRHKEALQYYTRAAELEPYDALTQYYLARSYIGNGDPVGTKDALEKAIQLNPHIGFFHTDLGSLYYWIQEEKKAARSYRQAIKLNYYDITSRYNLSTLLIKQNKIEEARNQVDKILKITPTYEPAFKQMGRIYLMEGNFASAEEFFKRSLMLKQNEADVTYFLAQSVEKQGRIDEALEYYKKFLEIAPAYLKEQIEWVENHIQELSR